MRRGPKGGKLERVWSGDGGLAEVGGWIEWGGWLVSHAKPYLCVGYYCVLQLSKNSSAKVGAGA